MFKQQYPDRKPPPDFRSIQATYAHLPSEIIQKIMSFLLSDPKALVHYLSVNKAHYAHCNSFNSFWKQHAVKNSKLIRTLSKVDKLPSNRDGNNKLKVAQIFVEDKKTELALELERLKTGTPPPSHPGYWRRCPGFYEKCPKITAAIICSVLGFAISVFISEITDLKTKYAIVLITLMTIAGAFIGLLPTLYPIIKSCCVQYNIHATEQKLKILQQPLDEERGEQLPLLTAQRPKV